MGEVAGHDEAVVAYEGLAGCADALLAICCEGDVGCAGMASVKGPFCFAVADDEDTGVGHVCGVRLAGARCVNVEGYLSIECRCSRMRSMNPHLVVMTSTRGA